MHMFMFSYVAFKYKHTSSSHDHYDCDHDHRQGYDHHQQHSWLYCHASDDEQFELKVLLQCCTRSITSWQLVCLAFMCGNKTQRHEGENTKNKNKNKKKPRIRRRKFVC